MSRFLNTENKYGPSLTVQAIEKKIRKIEREEKADRFKTVFTKLAQKFSFENFCKETVQDINDTPFFIDDFTYYLEWCIAKKELKEKGVNTEEERDLLNYMSDNSDYMIFQFDPSLKSEEDAISYLSDFLSDI